MGYLSCSFIYKVSILMKNKWIDFIYIDMYNFISITYFIYIIQNFGVPVNFKYMIYIKWNTYI